ELAAKKPLGTAIVHHQHHDVRLRSADLQTEAAALDADGARSRPAGSALLAAEHEAASILRTQDEGSFLEAWHEHATTGFIEQILRDLLVFCPHDFFEHAGCIFEPLVFVRTCKKKSDSEWKCKNGAVHHHSR